MTNKIADPFPLSTAAINEAIAHEDGAVLRQRIAGLGFTQASLARYMHTLGDHREPGIIARTLANQCSGSTKVSGEMRVVMSLLEACAPGALPPRLTR